MSDQVQEPREDDSEEPFSMKPEDDPLWPTKHEDPQPLTNVEVWREINSLRGEVDEFKKLLREHELFYSRALDEAKLCIVYDLPNFLAKSLGSHVRLTALKKEKDELAK